MLLPASCRYELHQKQIDTFFFWDDTIITKQEKRQNQPDHSSIILKGEIINANEVRNGTV